MRVRQHGRKTLGRAARLVWGTALVAATLAVTGSAAAQSATNGDYSIALTALTGPAGADLSIAVEDGPATLKKVQLKIYAADGALADVRNLADVPAPSGRATIELGDVERNRKVEAAVLVQTDGGARTFVLHSATLTKRRPDLVVRSIDAPAQTLTTRPVDMVAEISERNGDTGATARATLMWGPSALATAPVDIGAGGSNSVRFDDVALTEPGRLELSVVISGADPGETDASNNSAMRVIDVTEHEVVTANVLVAALGGYGAQLNQHVYAPVSNLAASTFPELESTVKAFEPQLVRVFYNENWEEDRAHPRYDPANMPSFIRTVELAQAAGATINITYQSAADARLRPVEHMARFAAVLEHLVRDRGLTNVRWVTIQNEPNTPGLLLTLAEYERLHRLLHAELVTRGIRDQLRFMGGDLVESGGLRDHRVWANYMATNMSDLLDAYSEHIYWNYWDIPRMEFRLRDVRRLFADELAPEQRKPTYIMEFAVRGLSTAAGKPTVQFAYHEDGTELRRTNLAAFQQLWFNIASAQLGFTGTAKWDLYWGLYDLSSPNNQSYWMVDPTPDGWQVFPTYHALRLMLGTTEPGWQVVQTAPWEQDDWDPALRDRAEKELAAYVGPNGELTVLGLDTGARALNGISDESRAYSVGGLPANAAFRLLLWNASGDGANSSAGTVTTNDAGVARFDVPLQAAFALTKPAS